MAQEDVPAGRVEFKGTSYRGDFQEALKGAINEALNEMRTDRVSWTLGEVSGERTFNYQQDKYALTVTIWAKAGPPQA